MRTVLDGGTAVTVDPTGRILVERDRLVTVDEQDLPHPADAAHRPPRDGALPAPAGVGNQKGAPA